MLGLNVIDPVTARYVNEYAERRHKKHGEKHEKKGHHENHDKKGHGEEHSKQTKKDDDGQNQGPEPEGQPRKDDQVENEQNEQFYDIDEDKEKMQDFLRKSYIFLDNDLHFLRVLTPKYNLDDGDSRFIDVNIRSLNALLHEIKRFFEEHDWILPKSRADNVITVTQVKSKVSKPFQAEREQDLKRDPVLYKAWRKATHHEE